MSFQLPDSFYAVIQERWDKLEDEKWNLGKDLYELLYEFPVLGRAGLLKSVVANTTCRYSSIDDYERVYRNWHDEARYDLNWSQMRACISTDIKLQREWAVRASEEGLSAERIYRLKTNKTWLDDVEKHQKGLAGIIDRNHLEPRQRAFLEMSRNALIDLLSETRR